ncbi:MAG: hypothetical protein QOJ38_1920 [Solirubrobacterales bacterium]|nr:hypothetical protein [Solirubrobacterales bacterium]
MSAAGVGQAAQAPTGEPARWSFLAGAIHLTVLWALAFQRPLFDLLGSNPDFFVARGNTRADIVIYACAFTLLPPLAMAIAEWVALRLRPLAYVVLHLGLVALLSAAVALQFLKDDVAAGPAGLLIAAALAVGLLLAWAYTRTRFLPQALTVLGPAPLLFLALFLFFSPVHKLVLPQKAAAASARVSARAPVVVLFFDEFPISTLMDEHGGIDGRRFPNFAELAAHSSWYRNTTTVADKTPRAVPAMLTGRNPGYHRLPIASDQPPSIFSVLGPSYETHAIETATRMCPATVCHGSGADEAGFSSRFRSLVADLRIVSERLLLPNAIARHLPPVGQTVGGFGSSLAAPKRPAKIDARFQQDFDAKLRRQRRLATPGGKAQMFANFVAPIDGEDRDFYFLDVQLPHFPWEYLETGQHYPQHFPDMDNFIIDDPPGRFIANQWLVDQSYARHMLQAGASDHLLGTLIARMKREGIWDRALLVVSADHGVSFRPGGFRREVRADNLEDIAFVPLFVKAPRQARPRVVDRHACTTEIPGLITTALGVDLDWHADRCDAEEVGVLNSFGSLQRGSVGRYAGRRADAIRRKFELFGEGWDRVYDDDPALIGRAAATGKRPAAANRIRFDDESEVDEADPEAGEVPALLQATISGMRAPAGGIPVAVAVNGRIAAVSRAYELEGKTRFIALVQPRFYRHGRDSVEVFRMTGPVRRPGLRSLGGANLHE